MNAGIFRKEIRGNVVEEIKLGVNLSKRNDVLSLLSAKQELGIDPFNMGYLHALQKSRKQLDLNHIRLCFKVSIKQRENIWIDLPPICSQVIYHNMILTELRIRDVSDAASSSHGGEKKILICDKFEPSGLQIVFVDEKSGWTGFGEFNLENIYNKSSIVFLTPAYPSLSEITSVRMELNKVDGSAASNPIYFTYYPDKTLSKHPTETIPTSTDQMFQLRRLKRQTSGQPSSHFRTSTYTYQDFQ